MTLTETTNRIDFASISEGTKVAAKPPPPLNPPLIEPADLITTGSVLLKPGTVLPAAAGFELKRVGDWDLVRGDNGFAVDRKLRAADWNFFFLAGAVNSSSVGFDTQQMVASAIQRVTRAVDEQGFNALEVTAIKRRRWMGVEYVRVTAHPRHARNSPYIRDLIHTRSEAKHN